MLTPASFFIFNCDQFIFVERNIYEPIVITTIEFLLRRTLVPFVRYSATCQIANKNNSCFNFNFLQSKSARRKSL